MVSSPLDAYSDVAPRMKALAVIRPLLDLDRTKVHYADWDDFQMAEIGLLALDLVTLRMGHDSGARQTEIVDELAKFAAVQVPNRTANEYRAVGNWVLHQLINIDDRNRGFTHVVGSVSDGVYERRDFPFRIFEDRLDHNGTSTLVATDAAINVLIHAIDVDIASEQIAAEAKIAVLLRRGKLPQARQNAELANRTSRHYVKQLTRWLDAARRDVRSIDWKRDIEQVVEDALQHLKDRVNAEGEILGYVNDLLRADVDESQAVELKRVKAALKACRAQHMDLTERLSKVGQEFRAELDRQVFAPPALHTRIDLDAQLLEPVLSLSRKAAESLLETFFRGVRRPVRPSVLYLPDFLNSFYEINDLDNDEPVYVDDLDDNKIPQAPPRFSPEQEQTVMTVLEQVPEQGIRLSTLLQNIRADNTKHDTDHLLALRSMQLYANIPVIAIQDGQAVVAAINDHTPLADPNFGGDDLMLIRLPTADTDSSVDAPTSQETA